MQAYRSWAELRPTIDFMRTIEPGSETSTRSKYTFIEESNRKIKSLSQDTNAAVEERIKHLNIEIENLDKPFPRYALLKGKPMEIDLWIKEQTKRSAYQEERRILIYIKDKQNFEKWKENQAEKIEEIGQNHRKIEREIKLLDEIIKKRKEESILPPIPGTERYKAIKSMEEDRRINVKKTHELKRDREKLIDESRKPPEPVSLTINDLNTLHITNKLKEELNYIEEKYKDNYLGKLDSFLANEDGNWKAALIIVATALLLKLSIKFAFFYILAPIASRSRSKPFLSVPGNYIHSNTSLLINPSSSSCTISVDEATEVFVHPQYLQSTPMGCSAKTKWILNTSIPFSCIAAGLSGLTHIRAKKKEEVTVLSTTDPFSEVALLSIPENTSITLLPRYIVAVRQNINRPLFISRHWRVFSLHAWLTLQFRYLVFHGPVSIAVKGGRGVRVELAEEGRSLNPATTLGFSAGLRYESRRCETFYAYLSGQKPLLNDSFAGPNGYYIYEEMPHQGKGGVMNRNMEGLLDAMLKPFGI